MKLQKCLLPLASTPDCQSRVAERLGWIFHCKPKRVRVQRVTSRSWRVLLNFYGLLINDNKTAQNKKGCFVLKSPLPLYDMLVWSWAWHSAKATSLTISGSYDIFLHFKLINKCSYDHHQEKKMEMKEKLLCTLFFS